jgi:hypothetical protein
MQFLPSLLFVGRISRSYSTLPTVLDKLCMVANINTRKLIELKKAEIKMKETKIQALQEMIDSLEQKLNDQGRRLDAIQSKTDAYKED